MKKPLLLPLLAVSLFAGIAAKLQDEHLLRVELSPNTSNKYKVELISHQNMNFPGAPPSIDMKGSMDFELTSGSVDAKGLSAIQMKTTNIQIDAGQAASMIPTDQLPKEIVVNAKMDNRYHVTESKPASASNESQMMMKMAGLDTSVMFIELPEKAVKVGDTWTMHLPKNPMTGNKEYELTAKLVALTDYEGVPSYQLAVNGNFDFNVDMAEAMKQMAEAAGGAAGGATGGAGDLGGMEIKVKGAVNIDGTAYLAQKGGKALAMDVKMGQKQVMTVMGNDVTIDGTTTVKMKLAK